MVEEAPDERRVQLPTAKSGPWACIDIAKSTLGIQEELKTFIVAAPKKAATLDSVAAFPFPK